MNQKSRTLGVNLIIQQMDHLIDPEDLEGPLPIRWYKSFITNGRKVWTWDCKKIYEIWDQLKDPKIWLPMEKIWDLEPKYED